MINKKIKCRAGDIVKIILEDGDFCFGHILEEPTVAFYDIKVADMPHIEEIIKLPILFSLWVSKSAVRSGKWEVIGHQKLDIDSDQPRSFFTQDPISKNFFIYLYDDTEMPATKEQCEGLERAAVWDANHVEDRLRDYYKGVPNKWFESLRLL